MLKQDDKNFDDLIDQFKQRIYNTEKGEWRLKLLLEDLKVIFDTNQQISFLDAGCGFAQISQLLVEKGHQGILCDISGKMLQQAEVTFAQSNLTANFKQLSFQELLPELPDLDLILFHAVMEWLAQPMQGLESVSKKVKPGGYLSVLFYNRNAMVYSNVLKGGWRLRPILDDAYIGKGSKLTPPNPQYPHDVETCLHEQGFSVIAHTGIRVFHDYLHDNNLQKTSTDELFELEASYCRMPVYRDMGRYVHMLAQKKPEL